MISLILMNVLSAFPCEYVVDCTTWTGRGAVKLTCRFECWNGQKITDVIVCEERTTGADAALALTLQMKSKKWRYELLGKPGKEKVLVIRGSKTSPIKSVKIEGDVWEPDVTRRLAIPLPK